MGMLDKAKSMLMKNSDKAKGAVDKAGDLIDKKTGGKYASQVDSVQEQGQGHARQGGDRLAHASAAATPPAEGEGKDIA